MAKKLNKRTSKAGQRRKDVREVVKQVVHDEVVPALKDILEHSADIKKNTATLDKGSVAKRMRGWFFGRTARFLAIPVLIIATFTGEKIWDNFTNDRELIKGVVPQKNLKPMTIENRPIESGDGLTMYGEIGNILSDILEERLGENGKGFGARNGGASFINMVAVQETPFSYGVAQGDILYAAFDMATQNPKGPEFYAQTVNRLPSITQEDAMNRLIYAAKDVQILMPFDVMEAVFMATSDQGLQTFQDLKDQAEQAAQGKAPKIKIATASPNISGSFYTAHILSNHFNKAGVVIKGHSDLDMAFNSAASGESDICLFVEYAGKVRGEYRTGMKHLLESDLHILTIDEQSYRVPITSTTRSICHRRMKL